MLTVARDAEGLLCGYVRVLCGSRLCGKPPLASLPPQPCSAKEEAHRAPQVHPRRPIAAHPVSRRRRRRHQEMSEPPRPPCVQPAAARESRCPGTIGHVARVQERPCQKRQQLSSVQQRLRRGGGCPIERYARERQGVRRRCAVNGRAQQLRDEGASVRLAGRVGHSSRRGLLDASRCQPVGAAEWHGTRACEVLRFGWLLLGSMQWDRLGYAEAGVEGGGWPGECSAYMQQTPSWS